MNFTKKITAVFLALILTAGSVGVFAAKGTTPGYKLVNTYNEESGVITSDIYVTGGRGSVGQLGLHYDTELLDLGATVNKVLTADYDISKVKISLQAEMYIGKPSKLTLVHPTKSVTVFGDVVEMAIN